MKKEYQFVIILKMAKDKYIDNLYFLEEKKKEILYFLRSMNIDIDKEIDEKRVFVHDVYPFRKYNKTQSGFFIFRTLLNKEDINDIKEKVRVNIKDILCFRIFSIEKKMFLEDFVI